MKELVGLDQLENKYPKTFKDFVFQNSFNDYNGYYTNNSDLIEVYKILDGYAHYKKISNKVLLDTELKLLETYGLLVKLLRLCPPNSIDIRLVDQINNLYKDIDALGLKDKVDFILN